MSANPSRSKDAGKSRVLLRDRKSRRVTEVTGFFGTFFECYWWAGQNNCDLLQYTSLA